MMLPIQTKSQGYTSMPVNQTTDFLLPLLGKPKIFYISHLVNAYIIHPDLGQQPNYIYVVLKFSGKPTYKVITDYLFNHPGYRGSHELTNNELECYIMEIPEVYADDYALVMNGKFSQLSLEAKKAILLGRTSKSALFGILKVDEEAVNTLVSHWVKKVGIEFEERDRELWPIMTLEQETLDIDKISKFYHISSPFTK